ncbi:MAG: hypothetical protein OSA97_01470 [Nevskia sp.]|nr:hypothetical protein [Nevskia sp.]
MAADGSTSGELVLACAMERLAAQLERMQPGQGQQPPINNVLAPVPIYFNSATGALVLQQRNNRRYLLIINAGAATIYVGLGQQCNSIQQGGIPIGVNGAYELNQLVFTNIIYLSAGQALVLEA